jgi:hypothetical protein
MAGMAEEATRMRAVEIEEACARRVMEGSLKVVAGIVPPETFFLPWA